MATRQTSRANVPYKSRDTAVKPAQTSARCQSNAGFFSSIQMPKRKNTKYGTAGTPGCTAEPISDATTTYASVSTRNAAHRSKTPPNTAIFFLCFTSSVSLSSANQTARRVRAIAKKTADTAGIRSSEITSAST